MKTLIKAELKYRTNGQAFQADVMILDVKKHLRSLYPDEISIVDVVQSNYRNDDQADFYLEVTLVNHHPATAKALEETFNTILQEHAKVGEQTVQFVQLTAGSVSQNAGTNERRYAIAN